MAQHKWEYVAEGYAVEIPIKDATVEILLHVGQGIPGHWDNVQGYADIHILEHDSRQVVNERLTFSSDPDHRGDIVGAFFDSDGITENVGDVWQIDHIKLIDSATMEDGDERNDDAMIAFIEQYVKTLIYVDELKAAQEEGFCCDE